MLRTPIARIRPGMIIAENIFNTEGSLWLPIGMTLTPTHIAWLKSSAAGPVYIKNPYEQVQMAPESMLATTQAKTLALIKNILDHSYCSRFNLDNTRRIGTIVGGILRNPAALVLLSDIYLHDYRTFVHSVNVCLLATMIGLKAGFPGKSLQELALGSLLHDLGKVLVPSEILNKPEKLCSGEWEIIRDHSVSGFEILRNYQQYIPLQAAQVVLQHHENYDGSGYANGIIKDGIHEYARITAIADVYDAMLSDRPYRPALLPCEAYELMVASRKNRLDPDIVDLFLGLTIINPDVKCTGKNPADACVSYI
jgi:HD-GYP domain-containing protein (c-di-GMP phosphodiesterase class II)